jgi:hypothetical protein
MTQHPCCASASVSKMARRNKGAACRSERMGAGRHVRSDQDMAAAPVMRSVLVV